MGCGASQHAVGDAQLRSPPPDMQIQCRSTFSDDLEEWKRQSNSAPLHQWMGCSISKPHMCQLRLCAQSWRGTLSSRGFKWYSTADHFADASGSLRVCGHVLGSPVSHLHLTLLHDAKFRERVEIKMNLEFSHECYEFWEEWVRLSRTHGAWVALYAELEDAILRAGDDELQGVLRPYPHCALCSEAFPSLLASSTIQRIASSSASTQAWRMALDELMSALVASVVYMIRTYILTDGSKTIPYHKPTDLLDQLKLFGIPWQSDEAPMRADAPWKHRRREQLRHVSLESKGSGVQLPRDFLESVMTSSTICRTVEQRRVLDARNSNVQPLPFTGAECVVLLSLFDGVAMYWLQILSADFIRRFVQTRLCSNLVRPLNAPPMCAAPLLEPDPLLHHDTELPLFADLWRLIFEYLFDGKLWPRPS